MSTELQRYKEALEVAKNQLIVLAGHQEHPAAKTVRHIATILNPPPEYEEVEVVRLECEGCGKVRKGPLTGPHDYCCEGYGDIKLTGTLRHHKPQKVEQSWTLENAALVKDSLNGFGIIRVVPWPQELPPFGKTGTLTFTWQEEATS